MCMYRWIYVYIYMRGYHMNKMEMQRRKFDVGVVTLNILEVVHKYNITVLIYQTYVVCLYKYFSLFIFSFYCERVII